jgi:hypothetical protein
MIGLQIARRKDHSGGAHEHGARWPSVGFGDAIMSHVGLPWCCEILFRRVAIGRLRGKRRQTVSWNPALNALDVTFRSGSANEDPYS